jgi:hypothetical protein
MKHFRSVDRSTGWFIKACNRDVAGLFYAVFLQNRTEQNRTEQNRTEQNRTELSCNAVSCAK